MKLLKEIYFVKDRDTGHLLGSNSKLFFTNIGHIKTSNVWWFVKNNYADIYKLDLSKIEPEKVEI